MSFLSDCVNRCVHHNGCRSGKRRRLKGSYSGPEKNILVLQMEVKDKSRYHIYR